MQADDPLEKLVHETEFEITHSDGLHMRPAMRFVDIANRFDSDITVSNGETHVDGKSIMQVTMLAATFGTRLRITAKGPDAVDAVDALRELIADKLFDEPTPKQ